MGKLMPSPKSGTVVTDYAQGLEEFKGGKIEVRMDRRSQIRCGCGKLSMGPQKLIENYKALLQGILDNMPAGGEKPHWKWVHVGSSHSPSIKIAQSALPGGQEEGIPKDTRPKRPPLVS